MPKIVDHDERRAEILRAAIRVIDSVGLDNTTTRAIAHESGYSNGVLSHYFQDKDDILQSILVKTHREFRNRVEDSMRGKDEFGRLWAMLMQNLPLDGDRSVETTMEITFWPRALSILHCASSSARLPMSCSLISAAWSRASGVSAS